MESISLRKSSKEVADQSTKDKDKGKDLWGKTEIISIILLTTGSVQSPKHSSYVASTVHSASSVAQGRQKRKGKIRSTKE